MKPLRAHRFRGVRYHFQTRKPKGLSGICQDPKIRNCSMYVPQRGGTPFDLTTTIHEALHACFYDLDEDAISEASDSLAGLLWRLHWRKTDLPPASPPPTLIPKKRERPDL
jgi:hypothetical protein